MFTVLFVCTGNICRSPMAEYYLSHTVMQRKLQISSISAGVTACVDEPASTHACKVMEEIGIDMSEHRGQQLTGYMIQMADVVLVMERSHLHWIASDASHVLLLSEFDEQDNTPDIADPFGRPLEAYVRARERITRCIDSFLASLPKMMLTSGPNS